jgi:hypothetical protein
VPLTVGKVFTFTVTVLVSEQLPDEPITVYVVAIVGDAVTVVPVDELKVLADDHVYVLAPLPVRVVDEPLQITVLVGAAVTVKLLTTATLAVVLSTHPLAFVPATV